MTILCYGEAIIDLLGDQQRPNQFIAQSGGAPANVAVGVAKLGGNSVFLGGFGNDSFSKQLKTDLHNANVELVDAEQTRNTALAIVSLDKTGERSFAFHRHNTADLALDEASLRRACDLKPCVVHYCSNTLTCEESRTWHQKVMQKISGKKSYDVNLRLNLWPEPDKAIAISKAELASADLIKLSDEEQNELSLSRDELIAMSNEKTILVTAGPNPITIYWQGQIATVTAPTITPIDTTAGGDGFMSGVLYWIDTNHWPKSLQDWQVAVQLGSQVGALAVTKFGSFDALPTQQQLQMQYG